MKLIKKIFPNKEMRKYRKMHHRHTKELVKLAKEIREHDWSWLHKMVLMQIRHMYEYYCAGNNVWQADESRQKVIDQLHQVLDIQKEIEENDKDYDHPIESMKKEPELYKRFYSSIGKNILWWWD